MRLPPFLTEEPRLRAVLCAADAGTALLQEDADRRNEALSYRTSDEGLRRWERELGLGSDGSAAARRARVYAALTGGMTLTVEELKRLALTLTDAQTAEVKEFFARRQVVLSALFEGEAGDLTALREAVARRKPAHLNVKVQSTLPAGELVYHGTATPLSTAAAGYGGVTMAAHALFVGHKSSSAYDARLVRSAVTGTLGGKDDSTTAKAGAYAVSTGGYQNTATTVYDDALTRSALAAPVVTRWRIASASTARHAVFGGGQVSSLFSAAVDAVSDDLTASVPAAFRQDKGYYAACSHNGCAVFAGGGATAVYSRTVDVYGAELQRFAAPDLSLGVLCPSAAAAGDHVLVAGGSCASGTCTAAVNAYTSDFTKVPVEDMAAPSHVMFSLSLAGYAIFAGGSDTQSFTAAANGYDEELTRSILHPLAAARTDSGSGVSGRGAAAIGDFGLLAGGLAAGNTVFDTVDVFTVE